MKCIFGDRLSCIFLLRYFCIHGHLPEFTCWKTGHIQNAKIVLISYQTYQRVSNFAHKVQIASIRCVEMRRLRTCDARRRSCHRSFFSFKVLRTFGVIVRINSDDAGQPVVSVCRLAKIVSHIPSSSSSLPTTPS